MPSNRSAVVCQTGLRIGSARHAKVSRARAIVTMLVRFDEDREHTEMRAGSGSSAPQVFPDLSADYVDV
jgi:hypothetical protein